ncbi:unnamed protein product, partial [Musa textilis]
MATHSGAMNGISMALVLSLNLKNKVDILSRLNEKNIFPNNSDY